MSWRNPDAELHANGWPALLIMAGIVLSAIGGIIQIAAAIVRAAV